MRTPLSGRSFRCLTVAPIASPFHSGSLSTRYKKNVRMWTACCLAEAMRIYAPNAPFSNTELKVRSHAQRLQRAAHRIRSLSRILICVFNGKKVDIVSFFLAVQNKCESFRSCQSPACFLRRVLFAPGQNHICHLLTAAFSSISFFFWKKKVILNLFVSQLQYIAKMSTPNFKRYYALLDVSVAP